MMQSPSLVLKRAEPSRVSQMAAACGNGCLLRCWTVCHAMTVCMSRMSHDVSLHKSVSVVLALGQTAGCDKLLPGCSAPGTPLLHGASAGHQPSLQVRSKACSTLPSQAGALIH